MRGLWWPLVLRDEEAFEWQLRRLYVIWYLGDQRLEVFWCAPASRHYSVAEGRRML